MDFTLSPEVDDLRLRIRDFTQTRIIPLEADPDSFDEHENIRLDLLDELRARSRRRACGRLRCRASGAGSASA